MRFPQLVCIAVLSHFCVSAQVACSEESSAISLATHNQSRQLAPAKQTEASERIRKIVLNQGDDARALANLVQLTRALPDLTTSQLYLDLANDYLELGKYNQAANVLQQHLTQYPDEPNSAEALVTLVRLYSSSEVSHTQQASSASAEGRQAFLKYANFLADQSAHKYPALADDPALTFQRAVSTRLAGREKAAQGRLTKLKHGTDAGIWNRRARAEYWLLGDRKDETPLPVILCRRSNERPLLDGDLTESCWRKDESVQFAYDDEFLYVATSNKKVVGQTYETDSRARTYDADLSNHDHVRMLLDLDRDYATSFELAIDHRGWTSDRCWLDASWNPKWFVAAGGDEAHWTVEAAIPFEQIQASTPQQGRTWAVSWKRFLPEDSTPSPSTEADAPRERFLLLLFD